MVLNALGIDPGRVWRGPWRWFSEELDVASLPQQLAAEVELLRSQVDFLLELES